MTHLVDRLELEVSTADPTEARRLHDRLSRLHRQTLATVLERVLDQFSEPGTIQRLESLSLDLGTMEADELEQRFPERLERALEEALRSRLRTAQRIPTSPDRSLPDQPASAEVGPSAHHLPGASPSAAPSAQLMAHPKGLNTPAAPSPQPVAQAPGAPSGDRRSAQPRANPKGLDTPAAPSPQPAAQAPVAPSGDRDLELLACFAASGLLPWWAPRDDANLIPSSIARALGLPPQTLGPFLRQLAWSPTAIERLLSASDPSLRPLLLQSLGASSADTSSPPENPDAGSLMADSPEPDAPRREPKALPAAQDSDPHAAPIPGQDPARATDEPPRPAALQNDSLTLDGAGLALLGPFLTTLFDRLGWLTPERGFIGASPQQRAVALLGYLVDGDPRPPEWRLPLAKLLCGLPLDAVVSLEEDLHVLELAEADRLLQAVLSHGDGLLGDDVDSLRACWLQRPGLLSWRPQAWLLLVERRDAIDGALERLPWSVSWLRLPWMETLVQVGW